MRFASRFFVLTLLLFALAAGRFAQPCEGSEPLQGSTVTDLGAALSSPAGKLGFLTTREGRFVFSNGQRQRFWGVNVRSSDLPEKENAPAAARELAWRGVNLVRFSCGAPEGFERLDLFAAELKKNGVYVSFMFGGGGAALYFDERAQEAQRKAAGELLLHRNPHTGLRYVEEPGVAMVQVAGEDCLFEYPKGTTEADRKQLEAQWNRWLLVRYKDRAKLAWAWAAGSKGGYELRPVEEAEKGSAGLADTVLSEAEAGRASPASAEARAHDAARFLAEVEQGYFQRAYKHLRGIGVKCPIVCAGATGGKWYSLAHAWAVSVGDAVVVMAQGEPEAKPPRGVVSQFAEVSIAGKPVVVCDTMPHAAQLPCDSPMFIAAYAGLQDWDAVIWGDYSPAEPSRAVCMMAARMFLTGAISPGRILGEVVLGDADLFGRRQLEESTRGEAAKYAPPMWLPFLSRMRNALPGMSQQNEPPSEDRVQLHWGASAQQLHASWGVKTISVAETPRADATGQGQSADAAWMYKQYLKMTHSRSASQWKRKMVSAPLFVSDTAQLRWDYGAERFEFDAPACQGIVGEWGGQTKDLSAVSLKVGAAEGAITAMAMDGRPLKESMRILICAASPSSNGQTVKAEVGLKHSLAKSLLGVRWQVWALDANGRRVKEIPTFALMHLASFKIGEEAIGPWYEVTVEEGTMVPFK